jgi:hypothetical protein
MLTFHILMPEFGFDFDLTQGKLNRIAAKAGTRDLAGFDPA